MNLFDFALFVASTYAVKFKDCGSDGIAVKDVSITPCPKEPCELIHGQNYSIKINFEEQVFFYHEVKYKNQKVSSLEHIFEYIKYTKYKY